MFCAYHGVDHTETTLFTDEHILPYAAGGSGELTIRVCKTANDICGSEVDAPLLDNLFIASERIERGIRGHSGSAPCWVFHGTIEINGREYPSTYSISPLEGKLFVFPHVAREATINGGQEILIECEEREFERIVGDINKKQVRNGAQTIDLDHYRAIATRQRIEHPRIHITTRFDDTSFQRAYVKMALGLSHFILGEAYTRSPDADLLRSFLWERDSRKRAEIPIRRDIRPAAQPGIVHVLGFRDWHLLGILNTGPLSFIAMLFGKYYGCLELSDNVVTTPLTPGDGVIFLVNPADRKLQRFRFTEYIKKKHHGSIS